MIVSLLLLVGAGTACSKGKTEAQLAAEALAAGLRAHKAGNLQEAQADYREALVHDPQDKYAYYNLGLIAQTQGNRAAAELNYQAALGIDPNFVPALFNLAIVKASSQDRAGAVKLYRQVITVNPSYAAAHLNLGFLLLDLGHKKEGRAELAKAVQLDPSLAERIPPQATSTPKPEPQESPTSSAPTPTPTPTA
ncbi:MAG TPA: tetratricopeptide repeat protein [Actinomycetota bacterium]